MCADRSPRARNLKTNLVHQFPGCNNSCSHRSKVINSKESSRPAHRSPIQPDILNSSLHSGPVNHLISYLPNLSDQSYLMAMSWPVSTADSSFSASPLALFSLTVERRHSLSSHVLSSQLHSLDFSPWGSTFPLSSIKVTDPSKSTLCPPKSLPTCRFPLPEISSILCHGSVVALCSTKLTVPLGSTLSVPDSLSQVTIEQTEQYSSCKGTLK